MTDNPLAEIADACARCGHRWDMHGPEVPGCVECRCLCLRLYPSRAASAQYGVPCPTCGALDDEACRVRLTHHVTDTHAARIALRYPPEEG